MSGDSADCNMSSSAESAASKWYSGTQFPWTDKLLEKARNVWGFQSFRPLQLPVMNAVLSNETVFVMMPSLGGKSLCYQLPALLQPGVTLVISPYNSLIDDQVMDLTSFGIKPILLANYDVRSDLMLTRTQLYQLLKENFPKKRKPNKKAKMEESEPLHGPSYLVYMTPDALGKQQSGGALIKKLRNLGVLNRIVIDECQSASKQTWGTLSGPLVAAQILCQHTKDVPFTFLTSACSLSAMYEILYRYDLPGPSSRVSVDPTGHYTDEVLRVDSASGEYTRDVILFTAPLLRPNLAYHVIRRPKNYDSAREQLIQWIQQHHPGQTGLIFCNTRDDANYLARKLSENNIPAQPYHSDIARKYVHRRWREGVTHVLVATVAFGHGISHPNVRFVIHHTHSRTLETYYNESGRAGGDGAPADCVIFHRPQDAITLAQWYGDNQYAPYSSLSGPLVYADNVSRCRQLSLEDYFAGETHTFYSSQPRSADFAWSYKQYITRFRPEKLDASGHIDRVPQSPELTSQKPPLEADPPSSCGRCDVCTQQPHYETVDVYEDVKSLCAIFHLITPLHPNGITPTILYKAWCKKFTRNSEIAAAVEQSLIYLSPLETMTRAECQDLLLWCIGQGYFTFYSNSSNHRATPCLNISPKGQSFVDDFLRRRALVESGEEAVKQEPEEDPVILYRYYRSEENSEAPRE